MIVQQNRKFYFQFSRLKSPVMWYISSQILYRLTTMQQWSDVYLAIDKLQNTFEIF